jgi:hypothetical protein
VDQATLDGCRAKIDGARKQLSVMADEWSGWLAEKPYPSWVIESDTDPGRYCVYFDFSTPPPPAFSVIAGEIAHDLRSALDHLAWREAVECVGPEQAECHATVITFPLAKGPADFKSAQTLSYVGADARAVMERHQPYQGGQGDGPKSLGLLHWLNRIDKHRALHPILAAPQPFQRPVNLIAYNPDARMIEQPTWEIAAGSLVEGETKVACFRFDPHGPDPQVRVKGVPTFYVGFGKVPESYRGIGIGQTILQVNEVIDDFASLLP